MKRAATTLILITGVIFSCSATILNFAGAGIADCQTERPPDSVLPLVIIVDTAKAIHQLNPADDRVC